MDEKRKMFEKQGGKKLKERKDIVRYNDIQASENRETKVISDHGGLILFAGKIATIFRCFIFTPLSE